MHLKIKEIASISTGYQNRKKIKADLNGSHYLIQLRDFDDFGAKINFDSITRFSPSGADAQFSLMPGDVLYAAKGVNNFAHALDDALPQPLLAASLFFILRPKSRCINPKYLAWFLNQEPARHYFTRHASTGARTPIIRRAHLEDLKVPIPPLETQLNIVELDKLRQRQQRLHSQLVEKKQLLVSTACLNAIR